MKKLIMVLLMAVSYSFAEKGPSYFGVVDEPNFIIRWLFQDFCDHVYDPRKDIWRWPTNRDYGVTFNPAAVEPGDIIFVRKIPNFFKKMHPLIKCPYIIVTHGEHLDAMDESFIQYMDEKNVIAWFGIHPCFQAMEHPKYTPLPIGVIQQPDHYKRREKWNKYFTRLRTMEKKYLLYMNFADVGKPERKKIRARFINEPYCKHGVRQSFHSYLQEMAQSTFTLSPKGLGPDCYRTWEALLVGSIPIVRSSCLDPLYEGLPVLIIKNWQDIDEHFLKQSYEKIVSKNYDLKRLYMDYWLTKIRVAQHDFLAQQDAL